MKKILVLAALLLLPALLTACNTIQGVGRDITAGGEAIDRAVTD